MSKPPSRKVSISFRFDEDLLRRAKAKAKSQQISLNKYFEIIIRRDVGNIPNIETQLAFKEANENDLEEINDLDSWLEDL